MIEEEIKKRGYIGYEELLLSHISTLEEKVREIETSLLNEKELYLQTNLLLKNETLFKEQAEATINVLETEIKEGDYWQERAREYLANGGCPICFCTDEEGHKKNCLWKETESRIKVLAEAIERLEKEKMGMVELTKEDMKKLGGSYT